MNAFIKDAEDGELDRANDARSASQLIEARWPGAVIVSSDGAMVRGWMNLSILLRENMNAEIVVDGRAVGTVEVEERERATGPGGIASF